MEISTGCVSQRYDSADISIISLRFLTAQAALLLKGAHPQISSQAEVLMLFLKMNTPGRRLPGVEEDVDLTGWNVFSQPGSIIALIEALQGKSPNL
jgi:hypothetical protein